MQRHRQFSPAAVLKLKVGSGAVPVAAAESLTPVPGRLLGGPHVNTPAYNDLI